MFVTVMETGFPRWASMVGPRYGNETLSGAGKPEGQNPKLVFSSLLPFVERSRTGVSRRMRLLVLMMCLRLRLRT